MGRDPKLVCQTTGGLLAHASEKGADPLTIARDHDLPVDAASADMIEVGIGARAALFDDIATRLDDPSVGVSLAQSIEPGRYGAPERLGMRAPDLRTAIRTLISRGADLNPLTRFALAEQGSMAVFYHQVGSDLSPGRHVAEFVISYVTRLARHITGVPFAVRYAWFDHAAPGSADRLRDHLGSDDIRFDAHGRGIAFDASLLRVRSPHHDPAVPPPDDADVPDVPTVARARAAMANHDHPIDESSLARALRMSVRSLRRKLARDGIGYRDLRDEAIHSHARRLLAETDRPVDDIARSLGYAYSANFARAFRRTTGMSPAEYRASRRGRRGI
jgi:AraC-like DNA-binding protein